MHTKVSIWLKDKTFVKATQGEPIDILKTSVAQSLTHFSTCPREECLPSQILFDKAIGRRTNKHGSRFLNRYLSWSFGEAHREPLQRLSNTMMQGEDECWRGVHGLVACEVWAVLEDNLTPYISVDARIVRKDRLGRMSVSAAYVRKAHSRVVRIAFALDCARGISTWTISPHTKAATEFFVE